MIENEKFSLATNDIGLSFYRKWINDTKLSVFIMAPVCLIFYLGCFTMIVGISLKLLYIALVPIIINVLAFIYAPFFVRKKYINNLVKCIVIEDGMICLTTYQWFTYKSIVVSSKITEIEVEESANETFFKGKMVFLLKLKDAEIDTFYLIDEFFDNAASFLKLLK